MHIDHFILSKALAGFADTKSAGLAKFAFDLPANFLAISTLAKLAEEQPDLSLRPVYKKPTTAQKVRRALSSALSIPLVGAAGATAGGIGLGLAGTLLGGYLGYQAAPHKPSRYFEYERGPLGLGSAGKLEGMSAGAATGSTLGGLAGLIGGGLGGGYLGYRMSGGGKPREIEKLIPERKKREEKENA